MRGSETIRIGRPVHSAVWLIRRKKVPVSAGVSFQKPGRSTFFRSHASSTSRSRLNGTEMPFVRHLEQNLFLERASGRAEIIWNHSFIRWFIKR